MCVYIYIGRERERDTESVYFGMAKKQQNHTSDPAPLRVREVLHGLGWSPASQLRGWAHGARPAAQLLQSHANTIHMNYDKNSRYKSLVVPKNPLRRSFDLGSYGRLTTTTKRRPQAPAKQRPAAGRPASDGTMGCQGTARDS